MSKICKKNHKNGISVTSLTVKTRINLNCQEWPDLQHRRNNKNNLKKKNKIKQCCLINGYSVVQMYVIECLCKIKCKQAIKYNVVRPSNTRCHDKVSTIKIKIIAKYQKLKFIIGKYLKH